MAYSISATKVNETIGSVTYRIDDSDKQLVLMKATKNVYYQGELVTDKSYKDIQALSVKLRQVEDEFPDTVSWSS